MGSPVDMHLPVPNCEKTLVYSIGSAMLPTAIQKHAGTHAAASGFLTFRQHDNHASQEFKLEHHF